MPGPVRTQPAVLLAVAVLLLVASCGRGDGGSATTTSATPSTLPAASTTSTSSTSLPPATSTSGPSTTTAPAGGEVVRVWFLSGEHLTPAYRPGRSDEDALTGLLDGPVASDARAGVTPTTAVPEGTPLRSVSVSGDTATVDLGRKFESGGGSLSMMARLAQVVYTATEQGAERVVLLLDGEPVESIGGEGIIVTPYLERDDFLDLKSRVMVDEPAPGQTITSPFWVHGENTTFENNVQIELRAAEGQVLVHTFTDGTGPIMDAEGKPVWGPFEASVGFSPVEPGDAELWVYEAQEPEVGGQPPPLYTVPVRVASGPAVLPGASTTPVSTPDTPGGPGQVALLTDVRSARHEGYDRIVFEFSNLLPGYSVAYSDEPVTHDPGGWEITVPGGATLLVRMAVASGVDLAGDTPVVTYGGPETVPVWSPALTELVRAGDFEAVLQWAAGVRGPAPFLVTTLTDPPRLVVDIASAAPPD